MHVLHTSTFQRFAKPPAGGIKQLRSRQHQGTAAGGERRPGAMPLTASTQKGDKRPTNYPEEPNLVMTIVVI